jgi:ATP-dependent DNA helicase RecQ
VGGSGDGKVQSALRILETAGLIAVSRGGSTEGFGVMRLVASPRRITAELGGEENVELLTFLRSLWKLAGGDVIHRGVSMSPREVHRAGGSWQRARMLIDRLQAGGYLEWMERTGQGILVLDRETSLHRLQIDWSMLERRRANDVRKLKEMQGYVYTDACRRAFVLRYFGEQGVAGECGACDTCLGERAAPRIRSERTDGRKDSRSRATPTARERGASRTGRTQNAPTESTRRTPDPQLLQRLKEMRSGLAREAKIPAYCVFSDATLTEIAARSPRSPAELLSISGIGPARLQKYGDQILRAIEERP